MAAYQEFVADSNWNAERKYNEMRTLLAGNYSVELVLLGGKEVFRVWLAQHCDLSTHTKI
jgi:hypothetical protein